MVYRGIDETTDLISIMHPASKSSFCFQLASLPSTLFFKNSNALVLLLPMVKGFLRHKALDFNSAFDLPSLASTNILGENHTRPRMINTLPDPFTVGMQTLENSTNLEWTTMTKSIKSSTNCKCMIARAVRLAFTP